MKALVVIAGKVTKQPTLRFSAQGRPWTSFSVETTHEQGGRTYKSFHNVTAWDGISDLAQTASKLPQGATVIVTGQLRYRKENEQEGYSAYIWAESIDVVE